MAFEKHVNEILTYAIDWRNVLSDENNGMGDTINTAVWTITPTGLTQDSSAVDLNGTRTQIKVSGGKLGTLYTLSCDATLTTTALVLTRQIQIHVK